MRGGARVNGGLLNVQRMYIACTMHVPEFARGGEVYAAREWAQKWMARP
jgi:hypothetical protein